ncbi:SUMF1/EgtB/PvdO family nonheme iron enzyme [Erwinia sp. CPCC 100877]|nr:SUMF1/EgtB/PvdO family nonheme iron enzyme [Erwinia sp. CPCC 100877]
MDLFEQIEWANWKKRTDTEKYALLEQLLQNFVPQTINITAVELVSFELYGIKCRTFELEFDGEPFVFVPGNRTAILGWDLGAQGLRAHELLGYDADQLTKNTFKTTLTNEQMPPMNQWVQEEWPYDLTSLRDISNYINQATTELRKVPVPAMFVQKYALPAGTEFIGMIDTVTGAFDGDVEQFEPYRRQIFEKIFPVLTAAESLVWSFPATLLRNNQVYLEFIPGADAYFVYRHQECTHRELVAALKEQGFRLLTEDQWEFAAGAGTRRLFRWGNELLLSNNQSGRQVRHKMMGSNMFGLVFDTQKKRYELTADSQVLKLLSDYSNRGSLIERMLPLSTYYRSNHQLFEEQRLDPDCYSYRKAIVID